MNLQLENSWKYVGDDHWKWKAYLVGSDLEQVKYVEYVLHPTFSPEVVRVRDPNEGFFMETNGWGTFELKAIIHFKGGGKTTLTHDLALEYDPPQGRSETHG